MNNFHGTIPNSFVNSYELRTLRLNGNQLERRLPPSLVNCSSLEVLDDFIIVDFLSNQFHELIPKELGELNSLHLLSFSQNSLTGEIPSSLGKMTELESLDLSSNKLEGRIPEQLTNLTFLNVTTPEVPPSKFDEKNDTAAFFDWKFVLSGYGCGLVFGLSLGYIMFKTGKPWWLVKMVEIYRQRFVDRGRHKKRKNANIPPTM
ncbi:hypothetical protein SLEP1_g41646 [Rubroshorea leprosula]|uniref:Receptor-like protein 12 n=1 Tax=Rubroshorea leprosula TaxID=152421 RepID=A0AAV5L8J2_9ROSI|nr:hypothetical protein SLEP1_g41646 [Rubroshorea leprosula]